MPTARAAITAAKPPEFGSAGENWSQEGWLVRVNWQPLLPERHSPISTSSGQGNQGVYLAGLSETLGLLLLQLIEEHADPAVRVHLVVLAEKGTYPAAPSAMRSPRRGWDRGCFAIGYRSGSRPAGSRAWRGRSFWWRATSNPGDPATTSSASAAPTDCCSPPMWTSCLTVTGSVSIQVAS
jgi:hypothetical protein